MDYVAQYIQEATQIINLLDQSAIERIADLLLELREKSGRLFLLGVGGGAGHASHAVCDFRRIAQIEAYAPSDNVSELTARVNDDGWDTCYANWLRGSRLNKDDMVFVLSVGGGNAKKNISVNLVRALDYARAMRAVICGVVGRDGGYTAQVADEAQRLTVILAELAEQNIPVFPAIPATITSEAAEEATTALAQARDAVEAAEALRKEAKELMASGDLRKLDAVMAIKGRLRTVASDGLDTLGRAIAILAEGAPPSMPAQAVVVAEAKCPRAPSSVTPESAGVEAPEDAEDDAALELLTEPAEPEPELSDGPTEVPSAPEPVAELPGPDDPFAEEVERKLVALFSRQEFGLAYHLLRAARRVFPDYPFSFTEAELRLAAMSGHNNHAGMQGSELLGRLLTQALDVAEELRMAADDSSRQDMAVARAIVLHAVSCPLALFHHASPRGSGPSNARRRN